MARKKLELPKERTYLFGPIEAAIDFGLDWRAALTPQIKKLGIEVHDPVVETCRTFNVSRIQEAHRILVQIEHERGEEEFFKLVKEKIMIPDLRAVEQATFLTGYWDGTSTVGSVHEIVVAAQFFWEGMIMPPKRKRRIPIPVYLISPFPKETLHTWLRVLVSESGGAIFRRSNDFVEFLKLRHRIRCQTFGKLQNQLRESR